MTIKGPSATDILRYIVCATKTLVKGLDWSTCPLAQEVDDEGTKADAGDKEAREKVMSGGDVVEAKKAAVAQEKQEAGVEKGVVIEELVSGDVDGVDWGGEDDAEEGVVVEEVDSGEVEGDSRARGSGDGVPPEKLETVSHYFGHIKDYCRNGAPDVEKRRLLPPAQVGGGGVIAVHIHCLRRGFQLRQSLLWNLFVCSPFGCFHFFVTLFETCPNDEDVRQCLVFIRDECAVYLEAGTLHVAIARMELWDASLAKNTSAKFAIDRVAAGLVAEPRPPCRSGEVDLSSAPDVYLVCADCDNVFSTKFPGSLVQHAKRDGPLTLVQFRGSDGGVTGRMAYWSKAYLTLGGYDQEMKGSGTQDVDLRYRFRDMGQGFKVMNGLDQNYTKFDAGYSICNDPDCNIKAGLTSHKMIHVDPALGFKSFGQSNTKNWQIAQKKKNQPVRNEELGPVGLGIPWVEWVWWEQLGGGAPVGEEGRELGGQAATKMRGGQLPMPESFLSFGAWQPDETKIQLSERFSVLLKPGRCTIEVATVGFEQLHFLFSRFEFVAVVADFVAPVLEVAPLW